MPKCPKAPTVSQWPKVWPSKVDRCPLIDQKSVPKLIIRSCSSNNPLPSQSRSSPAINPTKSLAVYSSTIFPRYYWYQIRFQKPFHLQKTSPNRFKHFKEPNDRSGSPINLIKGLRPANHILDVAKIYDKLFLQLSRATRQQHQILAHILTKDPRIESNRFGSNRSGSIS